MVKGESGRLWGDGYRVGGFFFESSPFSVTARRVICMPPISAQWFGRCDCGGDRCPDVSALVMYE